MTFQSHHFGLNFLGLFHVLSHAFQFFLQFLNKTLLEFQCISVGQSINQTINDRIDIFKGQLMVFLHQPVNKANGTFILHGIPLERDLLHSTAEGLIEWDRLVGISLHQFKEGGDNIVFGL
jgi:hypothetical protein